MSHLFGGLFRPFIEQRPICVMARCVLENLLNPRRLDALFEHTAKVQYTRELLFSTVVDLMGQVVLGLQPSIHAAYQAQALAIGVSDQAVYDKLNHMELGVSAALVRDSATQAAAVIDALGARLPAFLPGYRTKILDGNHLSATEHRLEELRGTWAAPLPGKVLVVLDPERMVVQDVFLCQDGQAQERTMLQQVLGTVAAGDLWMADRNFCTLGFMGGMAAQGSAYILRQHGQLKGELLGRRKARGNIPSGKVFEQQLRTIDAQGHVRLHRRITVELKKPTRDGDWSLHLLTNLPVRKATAAKVAQLYARRWTIETMFQELTCTLTCEIKTLGYPKAALFGFCLALLAYHAVSVIKAALRHVHGEKTVEQTVSDYYLSLELAQTYTGMMIAIPPGHWQIFGKMPPPKMATLLKTLATHVTLSRYRKHPRGPKKPPPTMDRYKNGRHVATAKLIAKRLS
jgi:IS4 transposase